MAAPDSRLGKLAFSETALTSSAGGASFAGPGLGVNWDTSTGSSSSKSFTRSFAILRYLRFLRRFGFLLKLSNHLGHEVAGIRYRAFDIAYLPWIKLR